MKVKTSDLIGPALDWVVAVAKGMEPKFFTEDEAYRAYVMERTLKHDDYVSVLRPNNRITPLAKFAGYNDGVCWKDTFSPSTDWAHGGPIIEQENFKLDPRKGQWEATIWNEAEMQNPAYGPTILIATMRCFCCSKLGDVVDIPEELCQQQSN